MGTDSSIKKGGKGRVISIIVAAAQNGVIGKTGSLPWYLPAELAYFKQVTMGRPIIMGRVTHESIGRTLPGRRNIVISRTSGYEPAEGSETAGSLQEALGRVKNEQEVFVIGGESIYQQALGLCDRIYLTKVKTNVNGDKFFKFDASGWKQISSEKHSKDKTNQYDYEFTLWERKNK